MKTTNSAAASDSLVIKEIHDRALSVEQELSQLLLTAKQAAPMCGKSLRTWRTWDAAGWIPRPVRIGRSTLWRADELREWVAAGSYSRSWIRRARSHLRH
jgi:predicted DNA-binding transcriptional regulator AlpA